MADDACGDSWHLGVSGVRCVVLGSFGGAVLGRCIHCTLSPCFLPRLPGLLATLVSSSLQEGLICWDSYLLTVWVQILMSAHLRLLAVAVCADILVVFPCWAWLIAFDLNAAIKAVQGSRGAQMWRIFLVPLPQWECALPQCDFLLAYPASMNTFAKEAAPGLHSPSFAQASFATQGACTAPNKTP